MPSVSILIPHHAGIHHLRPLFLSLLKLWREQIDVEFVLVDNGSSDGSVPFVRKHFPAVRILSLGENQGFAPALNYAARQVESEWLCFLNNDVRVDPDWLWNLMLAVRTIDSV